MIVLLGFHTASTLSGSLRSPPSPSGEGCGMGGNRTFIFYLFPPSSGRRCPEGAEVGSRSEMKRNVRQSILSYRHRKRSRGIFYVVAVNCTYEVMIKSHRCFGCSSSHARRLTVVQGRFLAALEMTMRGGRYCRFTGFFFRPAGELRIFPFPAIYHIMQYIIPLGKIGENQ